MSFYRTVLAAVAAVAIATPVFAEEAVNPANAAQEPANAAQTVADNSATQTDNSATQTDNSAAMQQSASTDQSATDSKVNLNKATAKELMKVKGLNAAKARAIVAYRKKHGEFKSIDDLNNVKGFKKMKPEMMKEVEGQVTIE